ncbi:DsrE/DsrF-like family protein [Planctomycetes bacterium Poly30]|uniref:DsrE/DsrF-like family protein n=1 Tax=Saltatorellus ferox TaxID=2528018 RepID=A0A518EMX9_9BACT|nr:DsrE/DsrF-like family protein [Planctomycetes bacterium Poly30]
MKTAEGRTLQILITTGLEDADRTALGLNTALVAQSSGVETHVFFTLRGTFWACRTQRKELPRPDILDIIEQLGALGAKLSCCTKCLDQHCMLPEHAESSSLLRADIRPAGLASIVNRAASGMPSLTF